MRQPKQIDLDPVTPTDTAIQALRKFQGGKITLTAVKEHLNAVGVDKTAVAIACRTSVKRLTELLT